MTTTRETTIASLTEGDIVIARNGNPTPFPFTVSGVVRTQHGKKTFVRVNYAHGGFELPRADFDTISATVVTD